MKKALICILLVVMVGCVAFASCKTKSNAEVTISAPTPEIPIGELVDWNEYVTVTVNGEKVENPEISWTLVSGDPAVGGRCRYEITFVYDGETYANGNVFANYVGTVITASDFELAIGATVDWTSHVRVVVNGQTVQNPAVTWTLISGNPEVEGECTYQISYTNMGHTYTTNGKIRFVTVNSGDVEALSKAFAKVYDSYTFNYKYVEAGYEDEAITERDLVQLGDTSVYYIEYYDSYYLEDYGDVVTDLKYYLTINVKGNLVRYYRDYGEETPDWQYIEMTADEFVDNYYDNYAPYAFVCSDVSDLSAVYFEKTSSNTYKCKSQFLNDVADIIFGVNTDEQTYTSIVITLDNNGDVASIEGKYIIFAVDGYAVEDREATVTFSWSNYDSTTVTLPNATEYVEPPLEPPVHIDPNEGVELTEEQKTALQQALDKAYESIAYQFISDKGSWYAFIYGDGKYTQSMSYDNYAEEYWIYDWLLYAETYSILTNKLTDQACEAWELWGSNGSYLHMPNLNASYMAFSNYVGIADFAFTADMFGYVEDLGLYVVRPDKISALADKFTGVIDVEDLSSFAITTFTLRIDDNGNVKEWYMLADCYDESGDELYWEFSFGYSDFGNVTISALVDAVPQPDADVTGEQLAALEQALAADYSNVTVKENVLSKEFRIVNSDIQNIYQQYGDTYVEQYKIVDGMYYLVNAQGSLTEISRTGDENSFEYNVLTFHFDALNTSNVRYDSNLGCYYIDVTALADFDINEFAFYWSDMFAETMVFSGLAIYVEDGHVVSVHAYGTFEVTDEETGSTDTYDFAISATLSSFGTTVLEEVD